VDRVAYASLVLAFGSFWTVHVALAFGLGRLGPWWRGPLAFVVLPLAPYWGLQAGLRLRPVLWALSLACYAVSLAVARKG